VNPIYYAIGDIHGELNKLRTLHDNISSFHNKHYPERPHTRIHLGDYIDRGPKSCGVIKYVQALDEDEDFEVINLLGNHEIMMLEAHKTTNKIALRHWLANGGKETMRSYQRHQTIHEIERHLEWISLLPTIFKDESRNLIFVHAGINPETYPDEDPSIHLWTRNKSFFESENWTNPALKGVTIIHGHTPTLVNYPEISKDGRRINLDTGACYGGPLTAVALTEGEKPRFIFSH